MSEQGIKENFSVLYKLQLSVIKILRLFLLKLRSYLQFFQVFLVKSKQKKSVYQSQIRLIPRANPAPLPSDETDRLKALYRYNILDTLPEEAFDDLTALACYICGTPIALISFIDAHRQWFKSTVGVEATETSRDLSFCAYAILKPNELLIVPNALEDQRFATNPLVLSDPSLRFYAGVPLVTSDGLPLGTLCVIDKIPRQLTNKQIEALQALGRQVSSQLDLRIHVTELEHTVAKRKQAEAALQQQGEWLELTLSSIGDAVIAIDMTATITFINPWAEVLTGWLVEEAVGHKIDEVFEIIDEQTRCRVAIPVEEVVRERVIAEWSKCIVLLARDGREIPIDYSCAPILSSSGSMYGAVLAFRNINDRRQVERARLQLLEREQAAREEAQTAQNHTTNILESITDGFFAVDNEWRFTYLNPQTKPLIQRSPDELLGKNIWDEFPETVGSLLCAQLHRAAFHRIPVEFEEFYPPLDIWFAVHAYPAKNGLSVYLQDISKRKQAEAEILQTQAFLNSIIQNIPHTILVKDAEKLRFVICNQAAGELFGVNQQELVGQNNYNLFSKEQADLLTAKDREALSEGKLLDIAEERIQTRSMETRILHTKKIPLLDSTGRPQYLLSISEDITERLWAEDALRESEQRFRQLAENIREVFWIYSTDKRQVLYASPAYESIWGRSCASLYDQHHSWVDAIHPEDQERLLASYGERLRGDYDQEYRMIRDDGAIRWIRDRSSPVQNEAGQIYRLVGIADDITSRKQAEEEIHFLQMITKAVFESQDFHTALRIALENVCEATNWDFAEAWIPRPDGTVLECSSTWYSRADTFQEFRRISEGFTFTLGTGLAGRVWQSKQPEWRSDVSADSPQVYLRAQWAKESGLRAALGIPIIANDVVLAVLVFYMLEFREPDQRLIELISAATELGLFIQRKRIEEEVLKSIEREKELNELKSRFISMASHEFRTPLTAIQGSADLLEHYSHKFSDEKKLTHLHRIQANVKNMVQLLDDILLIGKVEAGKLEFQPVPLRLGQYCWNFVEEMQLSAGSQHKIAFSIIEECQCKLPSLDEKLLRQILTNLLSNAIKYSPQGGIIDFQLACQEGQAIFQIKDQGIGIPKEDIQKLFESFHRAKNVGKISGTGLGLSIVKRSVDLYGGQISVESEVGVGSTFTVTLPLH